MSPVATSTTSLAARLANLQPALAHAAPRVPDADDWSQAAPADSLTLSPDSQSAAAPDDQGLASEIADTARANRAAALTLFRDPAEAAAATTDIRQQLLDRGSAAQDVHAPLATAQLLPLLA